MAFTALMILSFMAGFTCGVFFFGTKEDDDGEE